MAKPWVNQRVYGRDSQTVQGGTVYLSLQLRYTIV